MFDWLGGLFSGGAQIASTAMQNQAAADRQNEANAFNASQADIGRSFAREQTDQAMRYNSAEAAASRQFTADFNSKEAQINRDYQTQMSNSAYQRAKSDMTAAGLNPILAYRQGGAGTPSGATASTGSSSASVSPSGSANAAAAHAAPVASLLSPGAMQSAFEAMKVMPQVDQIKATTDTTKQAEKIGKQEEIYRNRLGQTEAARKENVQKDTDLKEAQRQATLGGRSKVAGVDTDYFAGTFSKALERLIGRSKSDNSSEQSSAKGLQEMYNGN